MSQPSTICDRLREARQRAGFETATQAAERFRWTVPTYLAHENGSRGIRRERLATYARAFKVPLLWLLTGEGPQETPDYAGIIGKIGAGAQILPVDGAQPLGAVKVPPALKSRQEMVGFVVEGDSQYPVFRDGDMVFCGAVTAEVEASIGKECAVQEHDGPAYLKTLERGSKTGLFDLISYNAPPIRDVLIDWVRPVLFIKRS